MIASAEKCQAGDRTARCATCANDTRVITAYIQQPAEGLKQFIGYLVSMHCKSGEGGRIIKSKQRGAKQQGTPRTNEWYSPRRETIYRVPVALCLWKKCRL